MWRGTVRRGLIWPIAVELGMAVRGLARADDLSTEPFGALCWVLRTQTWHGKIGLGQVGLCRARPYAIRCGPLRIGMATAVDDSTEGQPSLLSSLRADLARRFELGQGGAGHAMARLCMAWLYAKGQSQLGHFPWLALFYFHCYSCMSFVSTNQNY